MPRAIVARRLQNGLLRKGFRRFSTDHWKFVYYTLAGTKTGVWTKTSHGRSGRVFSEELIGEIRRQLGGLSRHQLEQLIECPLSQQEFEEHLRERNLI